MADSGGVRRFSAVDVLLISGLVLSLLLMIFLLIAACNGNDYRSPGAWAVVAMVALSLAFVAAGAGYGLSFRNTVWLWAITGFGGMQIVQVCFHIFPLSVAVVGMDLLWLLAGCLLVLGAELARRGTVLLPQAGAESAQRSPESRLKQLKQLHDSGLLSDAEHADARKQVLSAIQA